jgi:hypothetical protein
MADNKFERVEPDSLDRCQGIFTNGQCPFKRAPGTNFCPMHGGPPAANSAAAQSIRTYRLAKWRDRHSELADDDNIKSLREEIGILRIVMEETLNMCRTSEEILMYSSKISDLAVKLEKLVSSCHRLEASTGVLLDKTAAIHLASVIVRIIGQYVTDDDVISSISGDIVAAIATTNVKGAL